VYRRSIEEQQKKLSFSLSCLSRTLLKSINKRVSEI
jgi:hypothetical protein